MPARRPVHLFEPGGHVTAPVCPHGFPSLASCMTCMEDEGVGPAPTVELTIDRTFTAKFDGECGSCRFPIHGSENYGQGAHRVSLMSNGAYWHTACSKRLGA